MVMLSWNLACSFIKRCLGSWSRWCWYDMVSVVDCVFVYLQVDGRVVDEERAAGKVTLVLGVEEFPVFVAEFENEALSGTV